MIYTLAGGVNRQISYKFSKLLTSLSAVTIPIAAAYIIINNPLPIAPPAPPPTIASKQISPGFPTKPFNGKMNDTKDPAAGTNTPEAQQFGWKTKNHSQGFSPGMSLTPSVVDESPLVPGRGGGVADIIPSNPVVAPPDPVPLPTTISPGTDPQILPGIEEVLPPPSSEPAPVVVPPVITEPIEQVTEPLPIPPTPRLDPVTEPLPITPLLSPVTSTINQQSSPSSPQLNVNTGIVNTQLKL